MFLHIDRVWHGLNFLLILREEAPRLLYWLVHLWEGVWLARGQQ